MAVVATHIASTPSLRQRALVFPREHGAWGMLLVPLATGAVAALRSGVNFAALALFILAAMSLFWLRTPLESWLGTSAIKAQTKEERAFVLKMIVAIGALAVVSVAALLWCVQPRGLLFDRRGGQSGVCHASSRQKARAQSKNAGADHRRLSHARRTWSLRPRRRLSSPMRSTGEFSGNAMLTLYNI